MFRVQIVCVCCFFMLMGQAMANPFLRTEVPSSMNPVGSGARSLGMGGAFIGVADDATSASWNPGGLIQLQKPEISIVNGMFNRSENNHFEEFPGASKDQSLSNNELNYLSAAFPFVLNNCNMIVSLNYQHLYDFNREWKGMKLSFDSPSYYDAVQVDYEQSGSLYALGLAYSVQISKFFSAGFTLNFWDDFLTNNEWEQRYHTVFPRQDGPDQWLVINDTHNEYSFKGVNMNFGFLWRLNEWWTIGGVLKTPFNAKIDRTETTDDKIKVDNTITDTQPPVSHSYEDHLSMPMSYGLGMAYRHKDHFTFSFDLYRTDWSTYEYRHENGKRSSPVSGRSSADSDVKATTWCRAGMEYLIIKDRSVIPLRAGIFYDPVPSEGSPDDYFGFTLGTGYGYEFDSSTIESVIFDIAYQYRFASDVGDSVMDGETAFHQDVDEHTIYASVIVHFPEFIKK